MSLVESITFGAFPNLNIVTSFLKLRIGYAIEVGLLLRFLYCCTHDQAELKRNIHFKITINSLQNKLFHKLLECVLKLNEIFVDSWTPCSQYKLQWKVFRIKIKTDRFGLPLRLLWSRRVVAFKLYSLTHKRVKATKRRDHKSAPWLQIVPWVGENFTKFKHAHQQFIE